MLLAHASNVVYPGVNDEWQWTDDFDLRSPQTSILDMSYENFVVFQTLHFKFGDAGLIELFRSLPAQGSLAEQGAAFGAFREMPAAFQRFGEVYMAGAIPDSDGYTLPMNPVIHPDSHIVEIHGSQNVELGAAPFTLSRYALRFARGTLYQVTTTAGGAPGLYSAALSTRLREDWGPLPAQVPAACELSQYVVLLTNLKPGSEEHRETAAVAADVETACDQCLVGAWDLNQASFEAYMAEVLSAMPEFSVVNIAGGWRYTFSKDGNIDVAIDDFQFDYEVRQSNPLGGELVTEVLLDIDGTGRSLYWTDGSGGLFTQPITNGIRIVQSAWLNGDPVGSGPIDDPGPIGGNVAPHSTYSCSPTKLVLQVVAPSGALPPVEYDRVSGAP